MDHYPVSVRGELEETNRFSFLVKWLLLLPHWIAWVLLLIASVVAWVGALLAVVATGRYPRPLFDFIVGVMRYGWRLWFYGYGVLGTDKYPPFTLKSVQDYPADVTVEYPDQLHRGLALIKWWLLPIPHFLVLAVLLGSAQAVGLAPLLLLFVVGAQLFTGRYPRQLFVLLLGVYRWDARVWAYMGLVTEKYPPFRLEE